MKTQPELYYAILKECVEKEMITTFDLSVKLSISESANTFKYMEDLQFIKRNSSLVELLPQGFSTYLSISSQKQSNEQAQKATEQAIKATNYAKWALWISIVTLCASIFFSVLSYFK